MAAGSSTRYALARSAGQAAAALSRLTGRGSGTTVGGRVTLLLDPGALARAAVGRELVLVSGTNGKTTTRTLLVAALQTQGPVVSNAGGANLPTGLTAALTADTATTLGVLEVDEPFLPRVAKQTAARAVVLLNLSRDQLDRYAEVRRLAGIWQEFLAEPDPPAVIANADDPLVAWAASAAPRVTWVSAGQSWQLDATACPVCGDVLERSGLDWRSPGCGLHRPSPSWVADGQQVRAPDGTSYDVELALPGTVNVGNAALAAAAAAEWGVSPGQAFAAMAAIRSVEGRYLTTTVAGIPVRLLLAKNPAGWQQALAMARPDSGVVVAVNSRAADGRDPSWLWDVAYEQLGARFTVATGERSHDVAVRLHYADVPHERAEDLAAAVRAARPGGTEDRPVDVLANYTAFQQFRRLAGATGDLR